MYLNDMIGLYTSETGRRRRQQKQKTKNNNKGNNNNKNNTTTYIYIYSLWNGKVFVSSSTRNNTRNDITHNISTILNKNRKRNPSGFNGMTI